MCFFNNDDFKIDLDIYDRHSEQEFKRLKSKAAGRLDYGTAAELERMRKKRRKALINTFVLLGIVLAFAIYFLIIFINLDSLCAKYNITRSSSDDWKTDVMTVMMVQFINAVPYLFVLLILAFVIMVIVFLIRQKTNPKTVDDYLKINEMKDDSMSRDGFTPMNNLYSSSFPPPPQKPSAYLAPKNYTIELETFLARSDPKFDANEFIKWCKKSFFILWEAWSQGNIEAARTFLNDDLFGKMSSLLENNLKQNRRDIYRINSLVGGFLNKYERESGFEYLTVYLTSLHRRYVLDANRDSNIPIEGDTSENIRTTYQLTFMRRFKIDQETNIKDGMQVITCPNCGAEVTVLNAGRCEFCGSIIKTGEFSWVLSDIDEYLRNVSIVDNRGVIIH